MEATCSAKMIAHLRGATTSVGTLRHHLHIGRLQGIGGRGAALAVALVKLHFGLRLHACTDPASQAKAPHLI